MPDADPNSGQGQAGREGGDDDGFVVPIITPTTVGWLRKALQRIFGK